MSALECAMKLSREEVLEQIKTSGLKEYGLEKELLSERLVRAVEESKEEEKELGVVAALNNADTTGVLLEVLLADPQKVMDGIAIAAYALGTEKKALYLPEYAADKEEESKVTINLEILDASKSQLTQNEQVKSLIEKGCNVVCVNLVDRTEPTTITDFAENNNVPIIFFNRELVAEDLERWKDLYYVGADASESGTLEGELAADAFKENAAMDKNSDGICQYVVLEGEAGHQDSIVRTEYSVNTMVEKGVETEKLGYAIANWNRAQAQTKTAAMLTQFNGKIELIIANNDDMALGAIDALKASQIPKRSGPVLLELMVRMQGLMQ